MARITTYMVLLSFMTLLNAATSQLTPGQAKLKEQALKNAKGLLFGDPNMVATSARDKQVLADSAARQEEHLNKEQAVTYWSTVPSPPPKAISNPVQRGATAGRQTQQPLSTAVDSSYNNRKLMQTNSNCSFLANTDYYGGDLSNGYRNTSTSPDDCCARCSRTSSCYTWTYVPSGTYKGCWLKKASGWTKKSKTGYYSGKVLFKIPAPPPPPGTVVVQPGISPPPPPPTKSPPPPPSPRPSPPPPSPRPPPPSPGGIIVTPSPSPPPPPAPVNPLPAGKDKYGTVLGLSWLFYEAQRSGAQPAGNRIPWRGNAHLGDRVPGGVYDAGDTLKLNFVLAPTSSFLAWGILEFRSAYEATGQYTHALTNLRGALDYLMRCHNMTARTYVGQIGHPDSDHSYWGRPEDSTVARPSYVYDATMGASDLHGAVAAALAAGSLVYRESDAVFANDLLVHAKALWQMGTEKLGKYSAYYTSATASIYPSSDYQDSLAYGAGWLYKATGNTTYLDRAYTYWSSGSPDVYPCWDSVWAPHAVNMLNLAAANTSLTVPGKSSYASYMTAEFLKAWLDQNGYWDIVKTPKGLAYPKWSEWGNLRYSGTAAAMAILHAKYNTDSTQRTRELTFAKTQIDYALGSNGRSFVCGWWQNPPLRVHHAPASCPTKCSDGTFTCANPASCTWDQFYSSSPNPQTLSGALAAGPGGVRLNASDPDNSYYDKRDDYSTNEVGTEYNAGFTTTLAGLYALL